MKLRTHPRLHHGAAAKIKLILWLCLGLGPAATTAADTVAPPEVATPAAEAPAATPPPAADPLTPVAAPAGHADPLEQGEGNTWLDDAPPSPPPAEASPVAPSYRPTPIILRGNDTTDAGTPAAEENEGVVTVPITPVPSLSAPEPLTLPDEPAAPEATPDAMPVTGTPAVPPADGSSPSPEAPAATLPVSPATESLPATPAAAPAAQTPPAAGSDIPSSPTGNPPAATEPAPVNSPVPAVQKPAAAAGTRTYGPTRAGQTLVQVVKELHQDTSVQFHQLLYAIYLTNPQAFDDNNLNGMKKGIMLSIPSSRDVSHVDPRIAQEKITQQNKQWRIAQSAASAPESAAESTAEKNAAEDKSTTAKPTGKKSKPALNTTLKEVEKFKSENKELEDRLADTEQRIKDLLEQNRVRDEQLKQIRENLVTPAPASPAPPDTKGD